MERGRVGLMSTLLLAASGEPSRERVLYTRVADVWRTGSQNARKQRPARGANLSMMTSDCARNLSPLWLKEPNSHMSAFFARFLGLKRQSLLGNFFV